MTGEIGKSVRTIDGTGKVDKRDGSTRWGKSLGALLCGRRKLDDVRADSFLAGIQIGFFSGGFLCCLLILALAGLLFLWGSNLIHFPHRAHRDSLRDARDAGSAPAVPGAMSPGRFPRWRRGN